MTGQTRSAPVGAETCLVSTLGLEPEPFLSRLARSTYLSKTESPSAWAPRLQSRTNLLLCTGRAPRTLLPATHFPSTYEKSVCPRNFKSYRFWRLLSTHCAHRISTVYAHLPGHIGSSTALPSFVSFVVNR